MFNVLDTELSMLNFVITSGDEETYTQIVVIKKYIWFQMTQPTSSGAVTVVQTAVQIVSKPLVPSKGADFFLQDSHCGPSPPPLPRAKHILISHSPPTPTPHSSLARQLP